MCRAEENKVILKVLVGESIELMFSFLINFMLVIVQITISVITALRKHELLDCMSNKRCFGPNPRQTLTSDYLLITILAKVYGLKLPCCGIISYI